MVCFLYLSLSLPVLSVYAGDNTSFVGEAVANQNAPSLLAGGSAQPEKPLVSPPPPKSVPDSTLFLQEVSGLNPVAELPEIPSKGIDIPPRGELSEQAVGVLVDEVASRMVVTNFFESLYSGSDEKTISILDTGEKKLEVLDQLIDAIDKASQDQTHNALAKNYLDDWSKETKAVRAALSQLSRGAPLSEPLAAKLTKLYEPIAKRVSEITQALQRANAPSGDQGGERASSVDLLKGFSEKAKEFILNSVSQAQANLADGVLSSPLEATAFAAETAPILTAGDALDVRQLTVVESYVRSQVQKYRVTDSIYIGKDFIQTQKMLHPPAHLHPYLKWLLYTRNLTPRMMENYLATREAILDIYGRAKAGQGDIRYRGKVYGAFLPFAETAAGNYELVKLAPAE